MPNINRKAWRRPKCFSTSYSIFTRSRRLQLRLLSRFTLMYDISYFWYWALVVEPCVWPLIRQLHVAVLEAAGVWKKYLILLAGLGLVGLRYMPRVHSKPCNSILATTSPIWLICLPPQLGPCWQTPQSIKMSMTARQATSVGAGVVPLTAKHDWITNRFKYALVSQPK